MTKSSHSLIGFLTASLHSGAAAEMLPAVIAEAARQGLNLICLPGGRIGVGNMAEAMRNSVYRFANPDNMSGIVVWASSIGGVVPPEELDDFLAALPDLPAISISHAMPDTPLIKVDAYGGMHNLVEHFLDVHTFRKLLFIRGPENHQSAQQRWQAYRDTLETRGLSPDPQLVLGPWSWDQGAQAMTEALDVRKLIPGRDFEAVLGASDLLVFGALQVLQNRGWQVPRDVAAAGFNDTLESRLASPPMTTVAMPFSTIGRIAVQSLSERLQRIPVQELRILPTRLVLRQSCGCHQWDRSLGRPETGTEQVGKDGWYAAFLDSMQRALNLDDAQTQAWLSPLAQAWDQDCRELDAWAKAGGRPEKPRDSQFLDLLGKILERAAQAAIPLGAWQELVSYLQTPGIRLAAPEPAVNALLHKARIVISERIQVQADLRHWNEESRAEVLREVGRSLLEAHSSAVLVQTLIQSLPRLGIKDCWLVRNGRVLCAYCDGQAHALPEDGLELAADQLMHNELLPRRKLWSLVVEPLYFRELSLGYAILELRPDQLSIIEELRGYLSSSLHGIQMFEELGAARREAEKADQIKTRLLANVSHELRTPLNLILAKVQKLSDSCSGVSGHDIDLIRRQAEHQLRVVNDLLDLSRAEIDELDLHLEATDLVPLLRELLGDCASAETAPATISWIDALPERLPLVMADRARIRQVFLNLLSNARTHTVQGSISLGASAAMVDGMLQFWVRDTGCGIAPEQQSLLFKPFMSGIHAGANTTMDASRPGNSGTGLGLSITRHMVLLHNGSIQVESCPGEGTSIYLCLPIPSLEAATAQHYSPEQKMPAERPSLLLIGAGLSPELQEHASARGLQIVRAGGLDELEIAIRGSRILQLAWDPRQARAADWPLIRRARQHPKLCKLPFMVWGDPQGGSTSLLSRPSGSEGLMEMIEASCPDTIGGPIFVVDDNDSARQQLVDLLNANISSRGIRSFSSGQEALEAMRQEYPALVILDYIMPVLSGADVLDLMRKDEVLYHVPVLVLSNKVFDNLDIQRLENHSKVVLQNKGIWTSEETAEAVGRLAADKEPQAVQTSILVKRAIAYLNQHYQLPLSRWQVAEAVNVSEDYLSRIFQRELGIGPWDYLNRYRIWQASQLLTLTSDSIRNIALATGFSDQAYFSRVFRKITGMSPQEYRQQS